MDVIITGGAGFIGSNLARRLVEEGHAVRVLDNFSTGSSRNCEGLPIDVVDGDIRDPGAVAEAVAGAEVVFHQAALGSVPRSVSDPATTHDVNATGSLNVLTASRDARVRRVIYASSSSVYGASEGLPKVEIMAPRPMSPYAVSKLAGENYCRAFNETYGLDTISLRYFNVFGPLQDPRGPYAAVIPLFARALLEGRPPMIFGDGEQTRDFTYVQNVVDANLLAAAATDPRAAGSVMNIATGTQTSINRLVVELQRVTGVPEIVPSFSSPRPGEVVHSVADIGLAQSIIGYEPKIDLRQGLERTVAWLTSAAAR